jgi:DNA-binding NtrC family response regulator
LVSYAWPGNVRELRNVAERLVLNDHEGQITPDDLPADILGIQPHPTLNTSRHVGTRNVERPNSMGTNPRIADLFERLVAGEESWWFVQEMYRSRELARNDLAALIDLGLRKTRGSYRELIRVFGLDDSEYKRFHSFLYQAKCNLPVGAYRTSKVTRLTDFSSRRWHDADVAKTA